MRKIRKLSFFGVLGVVIAVLFLISISFTQAQVQTQGKPVKPPEATWAVHIPQEGFMLYGMPSLKYYENNGDVEVTVEKNKMAGSWKKYYEFSYYFNFKITNSSVGTAPDHWVGFNLPEGFFNWSEVYDYENSCIFPDPCGAPVDPICMRCFLNGEQPHPLYKYFWFRLNLYDKDIETISPGDDPYYLGTNNDPGDPGDYFRMRVRFQTECFPSETDTQYHDIRITRHVESGENVTIWIKRLDADTYADTYGISCEAVWRIHVENDPLDSNTDPFYDDFLNVKEEYCVKDRNFTNTYRSQMARGDFNFYIDFIKNPQSSTPPEAPSDLNATASACDQIELNWTDNSDNEEGFEIERDGYKHATVNANVTSYRDANLSENTTYSYRVRAFNNAGYSSYSDTASATTPPCGGTEPPDAPTGLTANARGKAKIALGWKDNSNNENGFTIYRGSAPDVLSHYDTVGPNITSYVDNKVSSKTTYFYKVCAYNKYGENCSDPASATTK